MSLRGKFSTVNDYPKGMMNLCPCGQVVLAPALYHKGESYWNNPNKCKELYEEQVKSEK
jgi:hypothetical protein